MKKIEDFLQRKLQVFHDYVLFFFLLISLVAMILIWTPLIPFIGEKIGMILHIDETKVNLTIGVISALAIIIVIIQLFFQEYNRKKDMESLEDRRRKDIKLLRSQRMEDVYYQNRPYLHIYNYIYNCYTNDKVRDIKNSIHYFQNIGTGPIMDLRVYVIKNENVTNNDIDDNILECKYESIDKNKTLTSRLVDEKNELDKKFNDYNVNTHDFDTTRVVLRTNEILIVNLILPKDMKIKKGNKCQDLDLYFIYTDASKKSINILTSKYHLKEGIRDKITKENGWDKRFIDCETKNFYDLYIGDDEFVNKEYREKIKKKENGALHLELIDKYLVDMCNN